MTYLEPILPVLLFVLLFALFRENTRRRPGMLRLARVAGLGLFLVTWPPTAWLASGSLEWWYPAQALPLADAEAIVVFAGGAQPARATQPDTLPALNTYLRCQHAAWLYRNWRQVPILVSGGSIPEARGRLTLAVVMQRLLQQAGVPSEDIWSESKSRSTYENASGSAEILRSKNISRVALVTEGYHMLRAELAVRKQGLEVVPAPCAFRSDEFDFKLDNFLPGSTAISQNNDVLHEWVGLLWYWWKGRI